MRCIIASDEEVIRDDLGIAKELLNYVHLVLQSDTAVSVRSNGIDVLLTPIDTVMGKLVLGLLKDEPLIEATRYYINQFLLSVKKWPSIVEKLVNHLDPWQGKRYVGLLFAEELGKRYAAREKLVSLALSVVNVGEHDLYVFSTDLLPSITDVKLCVSSLCEDPKEATRQALLIERYAQGQGVFFYENLCEYNVSIHIEPSDTRAVHHRLLSPNLEDFAKKMNLTLKEALQLQRALEEKYLLGFDIGVECHLYALGLTRKKLGGY